MAELVALFKKRRRWEQALFLLVLALQLLSLYNIFVSAWWFLHGDFPLMNARGAALILGMLLLRAALLQYLLRWKRGALWIMAGLTVFAQLTGTVDVQDFFGAVMYAFIIFPPKLNPSTPHA